MTIGNPPHPSHPPHKPILNAHDQATLARAPNIYLIGLMGAGKSTVGKLLAHKLGRTFYDSDDEIVARTGASIPTIFEIEGETGFREREQRMIADLCAQPSIVMGTGGGAILRPANREALKSSGWTVYLCTTPDRLLQRTRHDRNRPLLQTADPLATLSSLYDSRHPIYSDLADIVVRTGAGHVHQVVSRIIEQLLLKLNDQIPHQTAQPTPLQPD